MKVWRWRVGFVFLCRDPTADTRSSGPSRELRRLAGSLRGVFTWRPHHWSVHGVPMSQAQEVKVKLMHQASALRRARGGEWGDSRGKMPRRHRSGAIVMAPGDRPIRSATTNQTFFWKKLAMPFVSGGLLGCFEAPAFCPTPVLASPPSSTLCLLAEVLPPRLLPAVPADPCWVCLTPALECLVLAGCASSTLALSAPAPRRRCNVSNSRVSAVNKSRAPKRETLRALVFECDL